jgi:hypothetical protein
MRVRLWLALAVLWTACATLPRASTWIYAFQRPVTGTAGTVLPITDAEWTACDLGADRQATAESQRRRTALYELMGASGGAMAGAFAGSLAAKELEKPEPPAETAYREQTYERLMRQCLVNYGHAIAVPAAPDRSFGPPRQ